jgi:lactoylglutathione lyase
MQFDRTGFILYVVNYNACVDFYENTLELKKLFDTAILTCFEFGNSYLMIELDDEFEQSEIASTRITTCLRMNVANVKILADKLISKNIKVDYQNHSWGTVAKFFDPDGNLCAFKDSEKFELQVKESELSMK